MSNNESPAKEVQGKITVELNNDDRETQSENETKDTVTKKSVPSESKPIDSDGSFKSDKIVVGKNESLDSALRRFKRQSSGIISEVRKREAYDKPSVKRKKKSKEARKKNRKKSNYF